MANTSDRTMLYGLLQSLGLSPAMRNDERILKALENGEAIDHMQGMNETGLLDPFFDFLEEAGIYSCIEKVSTLSYRRVMLPIVLLLLTYMTKILIGTPSMNSLPDVLFSKKHIMRLLGFNAHLLENGLCKRGEHSRIDCEPPKPFSTQMLSNFVERFSYEEVESFFNSVIQALAKFGAFPKEITAILDGSDLETTEKCKDCGKVKRQKEVTGKIIDIYTYGFKLIALMDCHTQIPLAIKILKINEHESPYTLELFERAQANLKGWAKITWLTFDKGFIDGPTLYELNHRGIFFVTPAKKNMAVYKDAKSLAFAGEGTVKSSKSLKITVTGLKGLVSMDSYCKNEQVNQRNQKEFCPEPINAVVVNQWKNYTYELDQGPVFLTNAPVGKPLKVYQVYKNRSIIENLLFRENKQGWHLEFPPKKTAEAMVAHVMLTMTTYALTMAYRDWEDEDTRFNESQYRSFDKGVRRWRREKVKNADEYVIIFIDQYYGILHFAELAALAGIRMKHPPEGMESREKIYRRRGLKPPKKI